MSRQIDKKIDNLDKKFSKVLEIIDIDQNDFALESKINPGTLSKALERRSFSKDIVNKIYDRYGVRKAYWHDGKEPIIDEKHAYVEIPRKKESPYIPKERETFIENTLRMGRIIDHLLEEIRELKGGSSGGAKSA